MAGNLRPQVLMKSQDLAQLQAHKEYPSVSILLPVYADAPDSRQQTPIRVKNLVRQAEERLHAEFSDRDLEPLHARLRELLSASRQRRSRDMVWPFLSARIFRV